MTIKITRSFERTRQMADFVPIKVYCEATADFEISQSMERTDIEMIEVSESLDRFVQAEVEKTLMPYRPVCIVCGGKGDTVNLNKEGVCGQCVQKMNYEA